MKKENLKLLYNPFQRVAGLTALLWGVSGLAVSTLLSYWSGWHYHGLLHFGPAPNPALWCFAAEHAVVWLILAIIFYLGGLLLSKSKIRAVDLFGTTAFALLPMIGLNLIYALPPAKSMLDPAMAACSVQPLAQSGAKPGLWLIFLGIPFLAWALAWLYFALKVSCNLKGFRLISLYCIGIFGGDIICRLIIKMF